MSIIIQPELWYGATYTAGDGTTPPVWWESIATDDRWYFEASNYAGIDYLGGHLRLQWHNTGNTNIAGARSGTFAATPVVPGSVEFNAGNESISDDGNGVLTGEDAATGTVNYATGAWSFTGADSFAFTQATCLIEGVADTPALPASLSFEWEVIEPSSGPYTDFIFYYALDHGTPVTTNLGAVPATGTIVVTIPDGTTSFSWGVYSQGWDGFSAPAIYDGLVAVGETPALPLQYGAVINIVEKDVLDSFSASWTRPTTKVPGVGLDYYKSYAMDPNDPLAFWLRPRGYGGANVIVTYAGIPAAVTTVGQTLTLSNMYVPDLVDYLAYRALSKDARAGAKVLAQQFRESFLMRLGAGRQILRQIGQNAARAPDAGA